MLQLVVDMLHRRLTQSNPHKVFLATALAGKVSRHLTERPQRLALPELVGFVPTPQGLIGL